MATQAWQVLGIGISAMLLASVLFFSIKRITQRNRPSTALLHFKDYSFPSGHTTVGFVFLLWVALIGNARWGEGIYSEITYGLALLGGTIVGWSRRYLNVHRVSDVLVGAFLGIGSFVFSYLFFFHFGEALISTLEMVYFSL